MTTPLDIAEFIAFWRDSTLKERSGAQSHFIALCRTEHAAELKKRTLTNLYNQRTAWLDHAHRTLGEAVAAAYGWSSDLR